MVHTPSYMKKIRFALIVLLPYKTRATSGVGKATFAFTLL